LLTFMPGGGERQAANETNPKSEYRKRPRGPKQTLKCKSEIRSTKSETNSND
jgi:hypothetical protein